ncbi:hypothetical protein [Amycolatopsis jejuensis]|uniref:hypothetical protein n=1 Tax=Amycolatopsis jejuensis TaxID=330084 RepID=UPI0005253C37|nr:hypothetical protein [Amycolatopsis jejuensis]
MSTTQFSPTEVAAAVAALEKETKRFTGMGGELPKPPDGEILGKVENAHELAELVRTLAETVGGELKRGGEILTSLGALVQGHTGKLLDLDHSNAKAVLKS